MAFPHGRRPNVTNYLNNLNVVPQNNMMQSHFEDENSNTLWTNATFAPDEYTLSPIDVHLGGGDGLGDLSFMEDHAFDAGAPDMTFSENVDYNFNDFIQPLEPQAAHQPQFVRAALPAPIQTTDLYTDPSSAGSPTPTPHTATTPLSASHRRRGSSAEERSRNAAEEDKRRRNTAASARFRVKKKAKEAALEKENRDRAEKVANLERTISKLELENKWLKELVLDRKLIDGGDDSVREQLAVMMKKHADEQTRIGAERATGAD